MPTTQWWIENLLCHCFDIEAARNASATIVPQQYMSIIMTTVGGEIPRYVTHVSSFGHPITILYLFDGPLCLHSSGLVTVAQTCSISSHCRGIAVIKQTHVAFSWPFLTNAFWQLLCILSLTEWCDSDHPGLANWRWSCHALLAWSDF